MYSIIMPMDTNRLEQFKVTKQAYDEMPQVKEFIIPTRSFTEVAEFIQENGLNKDVKLVGYTHDRGFNPSKAFNIGVRGAKFDKIIITSPEVKPTSDVLAKFSEVPEENIVCQVFDQDPDGNLSSLVANGYRSQTPAMYFLAAFNRKDIEAVNGWDEDFMLGYAYEDNDFGERWVRAGLPFTVRDDITATHQYHPRSETIHNGMATNLEKFHFNNDNNIVRPANGLIKEA